MAATTAMKAAELCRSLKELTQKAIASSDESRRYDVHGAVAITTLKQVNRDAQQESENNKAASAKLKSQLDLIDLRYQNYVYEKECYQRDIVACKHLVSQYPNVQIMSEEEFSQNAPEELLVEDPHQRMINRMNFEMQERKRLREEVSELISKKKALIDSNLQKRSLLNGLLSKVQTVINAAAPVQQQFALTVLDDLKQNQLAHTLPVPLYELYHNAIIHQHAIHAPISVIINNASNGKTEEIYHPFPNSVTVEVHPAKIDPLFSKSNSVALNFEYLPNLNVLTVHTTDNTLLLNLFPNDDGTEFPNVETISLLPDSKWSQANSGIPFKWVQPLGGLRILSKLPEPNHSEPFACVLKRIEDRIKSRLILKQQIDSLSTLVIPAYGTSPSVNALESWSPVLVSEWQKFEESEKSSDTEMKDDEPFVPDQGSKCFKAVLKTSTSMKLDTYIVIPPEYPRLLSRIVIKKANAPQSARSLLKDMETKLNNISISNADYLISSQLQRLYELSK